MSSTEIFRVSKTIPKQGFNEFELGSLNHINPLDMIPDFAALTFGPFDKSPDWSPLQQQVNTFMLMSTL